MIPRGLPIQLFPLYGMDNVMFGNRWEEICSMCLQTLMQLIIKRNLHTLSLLDKEIEEMVKQLTGILSTSEMSSFKGEVEKQVKIWGKTNNPA